MSDETLRAALEFIADWAHDCSPSNRAAPWERQHSDEIDPRAYGFDDIEQRARAALAAQPASIDVAWARVEAALPEGVELMLGSDVTTPPERRWEVEASARTLAEGRTPADWTFSADFRAMIVSGPTPAAALNELADQIAARDKG